MSEDYELLFRHGTLSALRGDTAEAAAFFESCRRLSPDRVEPLLPLLECYETSGEVRRADAIAEELRSRWPEDPRVRLALARLKEERGEASEALELLRGGSVDLGPSGNAFPDYLRILLEASEAREAARTARRALENESVWRPDALLALVFAQLNLGDTAAARKTLEHFDPEEYADLIAFWRERLARVGVLVPFSRLLDDAAAAHPGDARLAALRSRVAG